MTPFPPRRSSGPRGPAAILMLGFVAIVLACIGVGLLWWSSSRMALAKDAPGFTLTSGTVVSLDFERIRRGRGSQGIRHRLLCQYTYEVAGVMHSSDVIAPLPPEFMTPADGEEWLKSCNVQVGGPIDVFYDPARPERSVLMREVDQTFAGQMQAAEIGGWVVLGVLGILVGIFTLVPAARRRLIGP